MEAQIYHLYHSGVAVQAEGNLLIFDYSNHMRGKGLSKGFVSDEDLAGSDGVFVFVSHRHGDHYNPVIFDWVEVQPDIKYILSDDIHPPRNSGNIVLMKKDQEKSVAGIKIKTYGSTDQGVSFLVEVEGLKVFHAGDLNWWHWKSFNEKQLEREERDYKGEIDKLKGERINIAFVPVDPRLEEYYFLAGEYFIQKIKPELFVPIHFGNNYAVTRDLKDIIQNPDVEVAEIEARGQLITYTN